MFFLFPPLKNTNKNNTHQLQRRSAADVFFDFFRALIRPGEAVRSLGNLRKELVVTLVGMTLI